MSHYLYANVVKLPTTLDMAEVLEVNFGFGLTLETPIDEEYIAFSTDYFGGCGEQEACSKINDNIVQEFNSINEALKYFGVNKGRAMDEFDTIKLGNFRSNSELEQAIINKPR